MHNNDDDDGDNQVKRKEPQELEEEDLKKPRPSTPPDGDAEGLFCSLYLPAVKVGQHTFILRLLFRCRFSLKALKLTCIK